MSQKTTFPYDILLDNIRSALNVGAIFRTCDSAGVRKLHLCGITPYPPHNRIPKTALGAEDTVEWEKAANTLEHIQLLKKTGHKIFVVEQTPHSKRFNEVEYPENTVLVFGHEITGVSPEVIALADECIELPMFGSKESLNVATTAGILAYHVSLQMEAK